MTNEEALTIFEKSEKCHVENCPDGIFCDECPWDVKMAEFDEAIKTIKHVLSKQCVSIGQADDVPDTNVGKTEFKPGDKFILELGEERKMFDEFEIAGTNLYVKTSLLEKLTRYEHENNNIHVR